MQAVLSRLNSRNGRLLAIAIAAALLLAMLGVGRLASAQPAGNNGTVKIHQGAGEPDPVTRDEPHVCTFHVHALFFDAGQALTFEIRSWPPTGDRSVVLAGTIVTGADGAGRAPASGAYSLPDGHYKLFVDTGNGRPTKDKHKVFWVACQATTTTQPATTTSGATTSTTQPATSSSSAESSSSSSSSSTTAPSTTSESSSSSSTTATSGTTTSTEQGSTSSTSGATSSSETTSSTSGSTSSSEASTSTSGETTTTAAPTTTAPAPSSTTGPSSSAPGSSVQGVTSSSGGGQLPFTGASTLPLLGTALGLIGLGVATLVAFRRRAARD